MSLSNIFNSKNSKIQELENKLVCLEMDKVNLEFDLENEKSATAFLIKENKRLKTSLEQRCLENTQKTEFPFAEFGEALLFLRDVYFRRVNGAFKINKALEKASIMQRLRVEDAAKMIGVNDSTWRGWEAGKNLPNVTFLVAICNEFNCKIWFDIEEWMWKINFK